MNTQRIYMVHEGFSEQIGANPDHVLLWDDEKKQTHAVTTHV
jgi:hypothetical protein